MTDDRRYNGLYRNPDGETLADGPAVIPLHLGRVFRHNPDLRERAVRQGHVHLFIDGETPDADPGDRVTFRIVERDILHEYPRPRAVDVRSGTTGMPGQVTF